jgi:hypothetical protein
MRQLPLAIILLMTLLLDSSNAADIKIENEVNAKVTQLAMLMGDSYSHEYPEYRGEVVPFCVEVERTRLHYIMQRPPFCQWISAAMQQ